uniref:Ankyrin repeat and SOCS box containing 10 n=1 Tax=Crocodylus porosus TaxID=8502 RepID=A0A7M4FP71_CROPO
IAFTFAFTPAALRSLRLDEDRALFAGDLALVRRHFPESAAVNLVIEARGDELRWTSRKLGLWSLTYEQELTTPLHITAGRGYADCLRFLLLRGAAVDFAPSGKTALHEACAAAHAGCARLLLSFGADPQAVSEDGFQPLHLCKSPGSLECARLLLQSGASVNVATEDEEDSPLHVAARHGLPEHVGLLLRYGAAVDAGNEEGQTPLHAACSQPHEPEDIELQAPAGPGTPGVGPVGPAGTCPGLLPRAPDGRGALLLVSAAEETRAGRWWPLRGWLPQ